MLKPKKMLIPDESRAPAESDLILEAERLFNRLAVGTWSPNVDVCEAKASIRVRMELPGVDFSDISLCLQDGRLRIQGIKREPAAGKLVCYYCLERRYGRFERTIPISWVVDTRRARAVLENGVLVVELPKRVDRRCSKVTIPIVKK